MTTKLPEKITHTIEALCQQGCFQVNQLLVRARNGDDIEELSEFSPLETRQIINELEQIMSVYTDCKPQDNSSTEID